MADPLALIPYAVAAAGGRINDIESARLVAAGLTLLQRSAALVRALNGRRSAILLPTSPQFLTALAASEGRGAVLVNPMSAPPEIAHQIADAAVGAVFTTSALASKVPSGITRVLLDEAPRTAMVLSDGEARRVDLGSHFGLDLEGDSRAEGGDEEAVIIYTSAMAGRPLGAILTHRNILDNARSTVEAAENSAADVSLAVLPFSHLFGLTVSGVTPLLAGGRVITMDRFNPVRALDMIEREGITQLVAVPAVFAAILGAIERRGARLGLSSLRVCICGGAVLSPEIQSRWADMTGVELREGYGLTEAGPVCLFNRPSLPNRPGTLGVPFPRVDVEIRDPADDSVRATGAEGEIVVRGSNVSPGYVSGGDSGLSRSGGWLRTGDLGVLNADGTVSFRGLLKPMFTRNGFNIYPREIENAVRELAGVEAVDAFAIPAAARENDIGLRVRGAVTEADVRRWCERRLSLYKQPSAVELV